jgi:oxaloacetate decarboxylase gamma subunit
VQPTLIEQGVELMLYGMGTVFVFLALLIAATSIMSALIQRYAKPEEVILKRAVNNPVVTDDDQVIAVISAAIHKYRSRRK